MQELFLDDGYTQVEFFTDKNGLQIIMSGGREEGYHTYDLDEKETRMLFEQLKKYFDTP